MALWRFLAILTIDFAGDYPEARAPDSFVRMELQRDWQWLAIGAALLIGCSAGHKSSASGATSGSGSGDTSTSGSGGTTGQGGSGTTSTSSGLGGNFTSGAGGGTCDVAAKQQANATCKLKVTINTFQLSMMACWVDAPFKVGDQGDLSFACGDGPAKLTFPKGDFNGTAKACKLHVTRTTQFPFVDGCTWQSDQYIDGPLDGKLTYHYGEKPIMGTLCGTPCTVDATLELEGSGPVQVENPK